MDELDHNLLMAWDRVFERCRKDPREARRRFDRVAAGRTFDLPNRAWCVAIRASDTRLMQGGDRGFGIKKSIEPGRAGPVAVGVQVAEKIVLDGALIRELGGPVSIPWPGMPLREAAAKLGRSEATVSAWLPVQIGKTVKQKAALAAGHGFGDRRWATYEDPATGWGVRYEPCRAAGRGAGMEVPVVWHDGPLDPGAYACRPPFKAWGSMWMSLAERIPAAFEQVLERVPVFYPNRGGEQFKGWHWCCPGLEGRGCGRRVRSVYAPLPAWTVGRALGLSEGLAVEGLSGDWLPGVMDRWAGRRSLACERCWRVKRSTFTNSTGWNELVTCLSGGLLFGREVQRPSGFAYERRRAFKKRRRVEKGHVGVSQERRASSLPPAAAD